MKLADKPALAGECANCNGTRTLNCLTGLHDDASCMDLRTIDKTVRFFKGTFNGFRFRTWYVLIFLGISLTLHFQMIF